MWQGIPTLVSSQSSIGKWLKLQCPEVDKCVITLTGDSQTDKETWIKNIQKHILDGNVNPFVWAINLKKFLRDRSRYMSNNSELGILNFAKDIDEIEFTATDELTIENIPSKVNNFVIN